MNGVARALIAHGLREVKNKLFVGSNDEILVEDS
jgi:hypothetical protein